MTQHEKNQLDEVNTKIDKILFYLLDDPDTGSKGLVSKSNDMEEKIQNIETNEKIKRAKTAGMTIVGSGVLTGLIWVLERFA